MNGHSKSVVMTFVVALAFGLVAEARELGPGGPPRRVGGRTFGRRIGKVGMPAGGRAPRIVVRPTVKPLSPAGALAHKGGAGHLGKRGIVDDGDAAFSFKSGIIMDGSDTLKLRFDGNRDGNLKPGGHGLNPQNGHKPNGLYDSPGDDTFAPKALRQRLLLGVGDGFAMPDLRVHRRTGAKKQGMPAKTNEGPSKDADTDAGGGMNGTDYPSWDDLGAYPTDSDDPVIKDGAKFLLGIDGDGDDDNGDDDAST